MRIHYWIFQQPYLLLSLTTLFWSGNVIAGKLAVGHISPFLFTNLRWMVALLILAPFALPHVKKDWEKIRPRIIYLFLLGAIGFTIFNNLMYTALKHTSAINVAIIQASMPLMVFILNYLIFRTKTEMFQMAGFILTLVGVAVVASNGNLSALLNLHFNSGDLLMLAAIMTYGVYSVYLRDKPAIHWLSTMFILCLSAFVAATFFSLIELGLGEIILPDRTGWAVVFYAGIFPSILSQAFWIRGLELIGSNRGGLFINFVPVIGSLLAILLLGELFHPYHAIAMVLVLGGVWIAQKYTRKTT